jgi:hypothetical protein
MILYGTARLLMVVTCVITIYCSLDSESESILLYLEEMS